MHPVFPNKNLRDESCSPRAGTGEEALISFVACAHTMLDAGTPEALRRTIEPRLLAQLPTLRALGFFELFDVRDEALRRLIDDELETMPALPGRRSCATG
jgi:hypothetical protein